MLSNNLAKLFKYTIVSLISITLYGCKSEIPSSSDNSDQPANQTIYNLTDSHSSDTAVIASPYEVDVNLESETSNLQVGVEPTAEAQASNIQLHFLDPQNTNRFNTTYSDACNSLDTSSSCQITLVPNNNAQLIDNQT
ncbi:hypothetical protein L3V83_14995, partial [Thiotrichales bacterium 19X7-9]|nr:hypothetical protein [Thiotrichales bacterium 19X7-9]